MEIKTKSLAELQALKRQLETQDLVAAKAAEKNAGGKDKLDQVQTLIEAVDGRIELLAIKAKDATQLEKDADAALDAMVAQGELQAQGSRRGELRAMFVHPENGRLSMEAIAGPSLKKHKAALEAGGGGRGGAQALGTAAAPGSLATRVTPIAGALTCTSGVNGQPLDAENAYNFSWGESGWDAKTAIANYFELQNANRKTGPIGMTNKDPSFQGLAYRKARLALAAGNYYKEHLRKNENRFDSIPSMDLMRIVSSRPLEAGDYMDPNLELGTLSGTLVMQRTLPVFAYSFPEFGAMTTDFSDAPGLYQQSERTRIVTQPAVIAYNANLITTNTVGQPAGAPQGWETAVEGSDTDVTLTLSDYVGVQIIIGQNILASTTRRLFDEQAVLAIKALAQYLATMVTNLFVSTGTPPNTTAGVSYNYYATVNGTLVPIAYPVFPVSSQSFAMSFIDRLDAAFTSAKVPEDGRFLILNPTFYAALRGDTRLEFLYAASAKNLDDASAGQFLTEARLPKLSGFAPYKAGYLPTQTPQGTVVTGALPVLTTNVAGFAGQKAGVILKSRLPTDFTTALPAGVQVPGSITTITDPDTKISISLVQFINLVNNYAAWRPEVMLGTTIGDNRGGLVLQGT